MNNVSQGGAAAVTSNSSGLLQRFSRLLGKSQRPDAEEIRRRYHHLIETSPVPINVFDASGEIVWGNDAVLDMLALESREELVGRSVFEFVHTEDRQTAERELLTVVEEKEATGPTEMKLRSEDGTTKRIRVSTAPGRYRGEDIGQAVVVDVTELTRIREDLRAERQFIDNALDTLQDVFYVIDEDGTLDRWNDTLEAVSGYEGTEIRTMELEEFFVEDAAETVSESVANAFATGEDVLEADVRTKDGRTIPYEFRKRRLVIEDEVAGLVGIGRDVSERRARDEHLRAIDLLLQHNLRNKLNVISASAEQLENEPADSTDDSLDRIETAADDLLSIFDHHRHIVDVLTVAESDRTVDVAPIVRIVVERNREKFPEATVGLEVPDEAIVSGAPKLERAINELVENALVHSDRESPSVEVSADVDDTAVIVRVADDGPPIPEMERKVVTGEVSASQTFHSQGLGFWFVQWVAKRSGGNLSFEENHPRGNVVVLELPTQSRNWR